MSQRLPLDRERVLNRRLERKASKIQPNARVSRLAAIGQAVTIPFVVGYCVFVMDFGEKEHVFSPPRRWLERQKAAFWTLSPSEQQTASLRSAPPTTPPASSP